MTILNLYGTVPDSIVDGPGLRYAIFVQGCTHACPGCHNPESQPTEGGTPTNIDDIFADIQTNKLIQGVTFSGGEPFEQTAACADLAHMLKDAGYDIWAYTGYRYEDLAAQDDAGIQRFLDAIDVLVDGPFIESLRSLDLDWRGSSNQRLIDIPASKKAQKIVEWHTPTISLDTPSNW